MVNKEFAAIRNFLDNRYSKDDYLQVISQFEEDETFGGLKSYLIGQEWHSVSDQALPEEKYQVLRMQVLQQILKQESGYHRRGISRFAPLIGRVAAILILPLFLATLYFYVQWQKIDSQQDVYAEIYCPPGTRSRFNLPDGSAGWLNSDSHLKYPVRFTGNRQVELSGEAFFDVAENKHSPFTVKAEGINVEALGTEFNVMAYPDCSRIEVSLEEGSVKVSRPETDLNEILIPDQRLVFSKTANKVTVHSGDNNYFTSWKDGYLVFRNVPLGEVAMRLSRWYNSEITVADDTLKNMPYRATFRNESLERVLSLLSMSANISYSITELKTNNDGTYEKQKVMLMYKK
ncbi:MAG: FecR domain-containing protein [Prolixibacteraceae bacterium]